MHRNQFATTCAPYMVRRSSRVCSSDTSDRVSKHSPHAIPLAVLMGPNHGLKVDGKKTSHRRGKAWLFCTGSCAVGSVCKCATRLPWSKEPGS
mmetsp:Transcript_24164/g.59983  ORF Transcript_24164/g.59983 Transcript_24164/m.59983 type:complete len:93 (+) Transcript_24164:1270-1548(+)